MAVIITIFIYYLPKAYTAYLESVRKKRHELSLEINEYKKKNEVLSKQLRDPEKESKIKSLEQELSSTNEKLDVLRKQIFDAVNNTPSLSNSPCSIFDFDSAPDCLRLYHALDENITPASEIRIEATFLSNHDNSLYVTTLNSCTCRDFRYNTHGKPCKHMYALAWQLGIIRETAPFQLRNEYIKFTKLRTDVDQMQKDIRKIVNTRSQRSPWLAKQLADYQYERDVKISDYLNSTNPRIKKTDELKRLAKEKRDIAQERNMLQNQLSYLFAMIPWLEEYITTPPKKDAIEDSSDNPEWDTMKYYLSADEYNKLTTTEKYQLALDRYNKRKKKKWEIGIDFERYIGSTYENKGYKVQYRGAIDGLEDMGRDVIAEGNGITYIIQCKRWSVHKTIYEKHIFQLYASSVLYMLDHPDADVRPLFVTTTTLSERASAIAKYLNVRVRENTEIKDYPKIKCNISKSGEKIYHLPFDQQYDHIVISPEKGECYCMTVAEAEALGFRRAKKWLGAEQSPS